MILNTKIGLKKNIVEIICLLYLLLFAYAATSKALDFEKFQVELGQSPLLSAFADWISWTVLIVEFLIVFFLIITKTRMKALYAGFCLMAMFTAYIFIMLNYSSFLPCSCGGILEKMSWQQHLFFNVFFLIIGGIALSLHNSFVKDKSNFIEFYNIKLVLVALANSVIVLILFLSSEQIMQRQNPFIRRYPHHPVTLKHTVDLKYNSYYFAGSGNSQVYLGNSTVPLYLLSIDFKLQQQKIHVKLDRDSFTFKSIRLAVRPPFFYVIDGKTRVIFRGHISDWKARLQKPKSPYFNIAIPIDSSTIAFRGISNNTNILGFFTTGEKAKTNMAPQLLQKQIDGIFDTDGMLHYSTELKRIVYIYSYRNEYIVADQNGVLDYRGNTIDTVSHAQIKVAYLKNKTERTMGIPTISVNAASSICGHLLFVNSNVPGRYEKRKVWDQASVIDVYDLIKKTYLFSFHIYGIDGKKIRNFLVTPDYIYALIDTKLVMYKVNNKLKNEMTNIPEEG
ncbi:MauE/DoxX family redox-associated membrane protein [Flavobacterium artemisiae]|uniref:MauE/DoxX family redox-associated membrane protein n=1 Tax=Flavobacterium artemisiae TaxID=2126556 RepID=A0ABW4HIS1_9FLAO